MTNTTPMAVLVRPLKHLRLHPSTHCPQWGDGDKVFIIGTTYQDREVGSNYTPCPHCWPVPGRVHDLKTLPEFFDAQDSGVKPFEVRRNDRNFQIGDTLRLKEWTPSTGFSGRQVRREVMFILRDFPGVDREFVVMGTRALPAPKYRHMDIVKVGKQALAVLVQDDFGLEPHYLERVTTGHGWEVGSRWADDIREYNTIEVIINGTVAPDRVRQLIDIENP